jgi:hypothetical protein
MMAPRWRQIAECTRTWFDSSRTTMSGWPASSIEKKSPGLGICSARPAHSQSFFHIVSTSRWYHSCET